MPDDDKADSEKGSAVGQQQQQEREDAIIEKAQSSIVSEKKRRSYNDLSSCAASATMILDNEALETARRKRLAWKKVLSSEPSCFRISKMVLVNISLLVLVSDVFPVKMTAELL